MIRAGRSLPISNADRRLMHVTYLLPSPTSAFLPHQDSTSLWESLPAEVMDVAIRLHHGAMRKLMVTHRAYESATGQCVGVAAAHA